MADLKFSCSACGRSYTWKPQLAGKRAKCKCGESITVPMRIEPEASAEEDGMYDLAQMAADAERAVAALPTTVVEAAEFAAPAPVAARVAAPGLPLEYQRAPSGRAAAVASGAVFTDVNRDYKFPIALLAIGVILYVAYYAVVYKLGAVGLTAISLGLIFMCILETAILMGFALVIAGPLGVNFGSIHTALLKFAAIVIFCDGVTAWVDGFVTKLTGGFGTSFFGFGIISFPVALGIYWACFIQLFSMDGGDAWLVVIILAVFYRIVKVVLMILLLQVVLSWGGVSGSKIALPSITSSVAAPDPIAEEVNEAKAQNTLLEARAYATKYFRSADMPGITSFYDAHAKNVWYEMTRDINGHGYPIRWVVELPDDKPSRANVLAAIQKYYDGFKREYDPSEFQDNGQTYMVVRMP